MHVVKEPFFLPPWRTGNCSDYIVFCSPMQAQNLESKITIFPAGWPTRPTAIWALNSERMLERAMQQQGSARLTATAMPLRIANSHITGRRTLQSVSREIAVPLGSDSEMSPGGDGTSMRAVP